MTTLPNLREGRNAGRPLVVRKHNAIQLKLKCLALGSLLVTGCAILSGCADLAESALYHQDVKYYESRGVSHQNAERAATEDEMFYDVDHGQ